MIWLALIGGIVAGAVGVFCWMAWYFRDMFRSFL